MSSSPRRVFTGAVLGALLGPTVLSGCAVTLVEGNASPLAGVQGDVTPEEFPIIGATDGEIDRIARNALTDLNTYWDEQFPSTFGQDYTPLTGGYYSVDPNTLDPAQYPNGQIGCGEPPQSVEDNAFYCSPSGEYPNGDAIQYDRAFLGELAGGYGRFIPALVMAHEFGHAVQGRVGYPVQRSINIETQADCFAGAWTAWVADGNAPHNSIRPAELDDVLRGYLLLRDPVGTGVGEGEAHGSYFDRVSAFQEGFDDGPEACRDAFGAGRPFTQGEFEDDSEALTGGNAPYDQTEDFIGSTLPAFWTAAFQTLGQQFQAPQIQAFSGSAPDCDGDEPDTDLVYCADDGTVGYDRTELAQPVYQDLGDYAVLTAVSIPYALAARDQLGLSSDDQEAVRSAVCLTGAYTQAVLQGSVPDIRISPGDVDESVQFLLEYSDDPGAFADADVTGFQLVDVFRAGVFEGLAACDIDS